MKKKTKKASDYKCNECDKKAVVFVGMNDPDAEEYPKCRKHADEWKIEFYMTIGKMGKRI